MALQIAVVKINQGRQDIQGYTLQLWRSAALGVKSFHILNIIVLHQEKGNLMLTWFGNNASLPLSVSGDSAGGRRSWNTDSFTPCPSQLPKWLGSVTWLSQIFLLEPAFCRAECWKWMSFSGTHLKNLFSSVLYPPGAKAELLLLRWKPFRRHNQSPKSKMLRVNLFCSQKDTHMGAFPRWIILSSSLSL